MKQPKKPEKEHHKKEKPQQGCSSCGSCNCSCNKGNCQHKHPCKPQDKKFPHHS